jgi:endoglucanase
MVAYELLNEAVAPRPELWNEAAMPVFRALRAAEPDRTLVLGSNWFNSADTFDELEVPGDSRCVLTFHFYSPMFVTHYRAGWWKGGGYDGPVSYPGAPIADSDWAKLDPEFRKATAQENLPFDRAGMVKRLEKPLRARDRTGRPLYCGEFGCYKACPLEIRLAWYTDIISVFKEYGIAWANWDHKGGFGLFDASGKPTGIDRVLLG